MTTETSPGPEAAINVVVCVPTFRRPAMLARTLGSLVAQTFGRPFAVVVVENEAREREGAAVARGVFQSGKLLGRCVVESKQGNVHAINAGFGTALADYPEARFFLMIDDDEIAASDWLARMVTAAETTGAGIVGGPVMPRLESGARASLAVHPAFAPAYQRSGPVPLIYGSGNCLITRETFARLRLPAFDVGYNYLGGGDTDFFVRAQRAGIAFHWQADAVIIETVPLARTSPRWLAARGLRIGAVNHRVECKADASFAGRCKRIAKSVVLLGLSGARAAALLMRTREPLIAMHPILVAIGRCLDALGIEPQPYRASVHT